MHITLDMTISRQVETKSFLAGECQVHERGPDQRHNGKLSARSNAGGSQPQEGRASEC